MIFNFNILLFVSHGSLLGEVMREKKTSIYKFKCCQILWYDSMETLGLLTMDEDVSTYVNVSAKDSAGWFQPW